MKKNEPIAGLKTYTIINFPDILAIPPENIQEFLLNMLDYYSIFKPLHDKGIDIPKSKLEFTPDGERKYDIKVRHPAASDSPE